MKIKKLVESKRLVEEDELLDIKGDSVEEIKDAIEDEIKELSDGEVEISDKEATEVAEITKEVAGAVNANQVAIVIDDADFEDTKIENRLTKALNKAYGTAKRNIEESGKNGANVLVEGLPGSGKTAIVESWCRDHGLILVAINATDPKIESAINGMPLRDVTKSETNELAYAYANEIFAPMLDPKNEGKCVLFVDELNRQKTAQLRRPFMSLFNEKRNASGSLDFRKTLLFSVVCINPFGPQFHDQGVGELNPAEQNRFLIKLRNYDSNVEDAVSYWNGWCKNTLLADLGVISPDSAASKNHDGYVGPTRDLSPRELEKAQRIVRMYKLATYILDNPDFSFSTRDDAEEIYHEWADYVTSRMFTDGINHSEGIVAEFLEWVDNYSNFTERAKAMFHLILDDYIMDTKSLYKEYNLETGKVGANAPEVEEVTIADNSEEDDDATLFGGPSTNSSPKFMGAEAEKYILDATKDW